MPSCWPPAIAPRTAARPPTGRALAELGQPIVLYMPMSQLAEIAGARCSRAGLPADTPAALIQSADHRPGAGGRQHAGQPCRRRGAPRRRLAARSSSSAPWRACVAICWARWSAGDDMRAHRRGAALGRRQDHGDDRPDARARAGRVWPCRPSSAGPTISIPPSTPWRRAAELQSRRLGDGAMTTLGDLGRRAMRPTSPIAEGVMGLFDGVAAARPDARGATADIAALLGWPVRAGARRLRPDRDGGGRWRRASRPIGDDVAIAGVILNRVASPRHLALISAAASSASG